MCVGGGGALACVCVCATDPVVEVSASGTEWMAVIQGQVTY